MFKFALVVTTMVSFMIGWTAVGCMAEPLAHIELGPGVFTTWVEEEPAVDSGVATYLGAGVYVADNLGVSSRVSFFQDEVATTLTELWAFLNYYPAGNAWDPGPYLSIGIGTEFNGAAQFGAHGGYQIALFSDDMGNPEVLGFLEAEGRVVNQTDVDTEAQANLGLRGNFGRR